MAHADEVKGAVGENLRKALDWLPTGRTLVTVKTDVALPFEIESLVQGEPDRDRLLALYERFGFRGLRDALLKGDGEKAEAPARRIPDAPAASMPAPASATSAHAAFVDARRYDTVSDEPALERWLAKIEAAELTCFDTETTSLDPMAAQLVGLSFCVKAGEACYIPLAHRYPGRPTSSTSHALSRGSSPGSSPIATARSARTPSTTATCSPTTASTCAAWCTTRCMPPTCWKATSATTWIRSHAPPGRDDDPLRGRRGQGRLEHLLRPGERGERDRVFRRGRRRHLPVARALWPQIEGGREVEAHLRRHRGAGVQRAPVRWSETACSLMPRYSPPRAGNWARR